MQLHGLIAAIDAEQQDESKWELVLERCASHPKEVLQVNVRGQTCVSAACAKNPPLKVIEAMLKEYRFGSSSLRDKSGRTALAIAISSHASLDVIQKLASHGRAVELSDYCGNAPLHQACMNEYRHGVADLVSVLTKAAPNVAKQENNEGKLPLHLALETKVSVDIVRILVEVCPETVTRNDPLGFTSLMLAIHQGADADVIKCLARANPSVTLQKDESGRFPLQRALELRCDDTEIIRLLCSSPTTVLETDRQGGNALHVALGWVMVNPEIVQVLLKQAPGASLAVSHCTGTPLHMAYQKYANCADQVKYQGRLVDEAAMHSMEDWWMVVCYTLEAATSTDENKQAFTNNGEWCILHAALSTDAPIQVIQKIVDAYPNEVAKRNKNGHYPLMVAAMLKQNYEVKDVVFNLLLDADITSIGATRPDHEGRVILFIAVEHGGLSAPTFHRILRANPEAIAMVDPKYQLYPFLIAALPRKNITENVQTNSIFELLLARPDVLQSILGSTRDFYKSSTL